MEFLRWVMLYSDILSEMIGEDRDDALAVMDDDSKFDAWMHKYQNKQKQARNPNPPKGRAVSKEEFLNRTSARLPQPGGKRDGKKQQTI